MSTETLHHTVLLEEAIDALLASRGGSNEPGLFIDGTFGRGGHSLGILAILPVNARLIAFDRDPEAIKVAAAMQLNYCRLEPKHSAFGDMSSVLGDMGLVGRVDGILLDLGVSSPQLDDAGRGFSFMRDGPLDMRMDTTQGISAAQWIN